MFSKNLARSCVLCSVVYVSEDQTWMFAFLMLQWGIDLPQPHCSSTYKSVNKKYCFSQMNEEWSWVCLLCEVTEVGLRLGLGWHGHRKEMVKSGSNHALTIRDFWYLLVGLIVNLLPKWSEKRNKKYHTPLVQMCSWEMVATIEIYMRLFRTIWGTVHLGKPGILK